MMTDEDVKFQLEQLELDRLRLEANYDSVCDRLREALELHASFRKLLAEHNIEHEL